MAGEPVFGSASTGLLKTDLGTDWKFQSQDNGTQKDRQTATSGNGDIIAETTYNERLTGSETYVYDGDATDYGSTTTGAIDAAGAWPGKYMSTAAVIITKVEIDYSPCAQGEREKVTFTFENGGSADSATYLPTLTTTLATKQEDTGVPELLANASTGAKIQSVTYSLEVQKGRTLGDVGVYLCGATYGGEETLNMQYVGLPSLTTTGWQVTSSQIPTGGGSKSNTDYDKYSITAVKGKTRVV